MSLDPKDLNLQKMIISLNQLVEQLRITSTTKKDMGIEDIIKALNLTFKTAKGDTGELKNLIKITKNAPNAKHYDKLTKMLELLVKTYANPDIKQMKNLDITTQNLTTELTSLLDTLQNINVTKNEKANLSLLSKAVAQGHQMYAITGFGKDASNFYKKATLEQLKFFKMMDKAIKDGVPIKNLTAKKTLKEKLSSGKTGKSMTLLAAGADMAMKAMGMGTIPGEALEVLGGGIQKAMDMVDKRGEKRAERNALKVEGLVAAKEDSQKSMIVNKEVQDKAIAVKKQADDVQKNLIDDLSGAIAGAMKTSETGIDARFASETSPGEADINKIADAIKNNQFPKDELEALIKSKYLTTDAQGNQDTTVSDTLLKNLAEVEEYAKIIHDQDNTIKETAVNIQTSIDTISGIFLDLREILGKELVNEIKEINKAVDKKMKGFSAEEKQAKKDEYVNKKMEAMAQRIEITADEMQGVIGGEDKSGYMIEYEKQGGAKFANNGKTESEKAAEAFKETSFAEALKSRTSLDNANEIKKNKTLETSEIENKIKETESRLKEIPIPIPKDLEVYGPHAPTPSANQTPTPETIDNQEASFEELQDIFSESMNDFMKRFDELIKDRDKSAKESSDALKKALTSGEVKVKVVNLSEIPKGERNGSHEQPHSDGNPGFGD